MRPSQPKPVQLDLFGPSDNVRPLDAPRWSGSAGPDAAAGDGPDGRMLLERRGGQTGEAETGTGGESGDVRQDPAPPS